MSELNDHQKSAIMEKIAVSMHNLKFAASSDDSVEMRVKCKHERVAITVC